MKSSKKTNTFVLWLIAIGLVLGMIVMFTPNLGFTGGQSPSGAVALKVNGQEVDEFTVNQARSNPIYYMVTEGEVGEDLELLLVDSIVSQVVMGQAASSQRISRAQVNQAVNDFRAERGVGGRGDDAAYLQIIGSAGFDDASFREYMRQQLQQQAWEDSLVGDATVSEEEVLTYFEAFRNNYRDEERIVARVIVVADAELANELRTRVLTGESFAELATEHSLDRADRGGALGAPAGTTEPQPVGVAALPAAVANAAFNLRGPGITSVISAAGSYYVVQVEEFIPRRQFTFEEVAERVEADALQAKLVGIVGSELERLVEQANVEVMPDSGLTYNDYVVATVGDEEIRAAELARATYGNAEVQQFLDPGLAFLITDILKPQILEQLIDQKVAVHGSEELDGATVFGSDSQRAQLALNYVARDVTVTDEDVAAHYARNAATYTVPASAEAVRYEFATFEEAEAFRDAVLSGTTPTDAANAAGVAAEDMGTVSPGTAETAIDAALFGTDAFVPIDGSDREISDVLFIAGEATAQDDDSDTSLTEEALDDLGVADAAMDERVGNAQEAQQAVADAVADIQETVDAVIAGDTGDEDADADDAEAAAADEAAGTEDETAAAPAPDRYLVLVAARQAERVRPLEEVEEQVRERVLLEARAEVQQAWLDGLREELDIVNLVSVTPPETDFAEDIDFSPLPETESGDVPAGEEAADEDAGAEDAAAEEAAAEDAAAEEAAADETAGDEPAEPADVPADEDGN